MESNFIWQLAVEQFSK